MGDGAAAAYKRRLVTTLAERSVVVAACRYVDEVVPDAPMPVDAVFLDRIGADLVVHGDDLEPDELRRWYSVPMDDGRFATVPYTWSVDTARLSTTDLVERLRRSLDEQGDRSAGA